MGFRVEPQIPDLSEFRDGFTGYWTGSIFKPSPWPPKTTALTTTFIRLAEMTLREYEYGRQMTEHFWGGQRQPNSIPIGAFLSASSSFETCITNLHRTTECLKRIRARPDVPQALKDSLPNPLYFIQGRVADRVRDMRNEVQHFENLILSDTQPADAKIFLSSDGPQREEGADIIKVIDRLVIGTHEIRFAELAGWLREMAECAKTIADNR